MKIRDWMTTEDKCKHLERSYDVGEKIHQKVELNEEGYAINGCCGGCYVIWGIKYCPFCGVRL